jgi:uncharacterized protein
MKIIAIEEHFVTDEVQRLWRGLDPNDQDPSLELFPDDDDIANRLIDLSNDRVSLMDDIGVDVQVLSLTTPGTQSLASGAAYECARQVNDIVAETVRARHDRFQGFATLPTPIPSKAARELERAVTELGLVGAMIFGRTRDRNADDSDFLPIYEAAAALRVPLYLHPQTPRRPVLDAYYSDLGDRVDLHLATGGIGWHYETGIQLLRMILSGVFDRFPDLQIIVGHWGEVVLFYLERIDETLSMGTTKLRLPVTEYFRRNVYVTPSGVFSQRYLRWAIEVVGIDRIMFSTDYPYQFAPNGGARSFLQDAGLCAEDMEKVAHGNWDRLCARRTQAR